MTELRQLVDKKAFTHVGVWKLLQVGLTIAIMSPIIQKEKFIPEGDFPKLKFTLVSKGDQKDITLQVDLSSPSAFVTVVFIGLTVAAATIGTYSALFLEYIYAIHGGIHAPRISTCSLALSMEYKSLSRRWQGWARLSMDIFGLIRRGVNILSFIPN